MFSKWFKLFKLIKEEEEFDPELEFTKIIEKYNTVKEYMESVKNISYQLSFYFREESKEEIDNINDIHIDHSNLDK